MIDGHALQLVFSLLGSSPVAIILVYYLGKIDTRISILEHQINLLEKKQDACKNFRKA